ncbi:MAG: glycosyltransferase family 1 protein [Lachnospiraceae bacterium]|nr:glycosyltransferase family 1 protein [Lachnospiraceae bacterium]
MKILYVLNDTLRRGGTESVILNYFDHTDRDKIQIDFVLNAAKSELSENDICKYLLDKGAKVFCIAPRREDPKANKSEFLKILNDEHYDIVHTHTDAVGSYFLKLAKEAGVKIRIAHSHNTGHQLINKGLKNRVHFAYLEKCRKEIRKEATHYIACSKAAGEWLFGEENVKTGKVRILNNAIDTKKFSFDENTRSEIRKNLNVDENMFILGHVGRMMPQKNHEFLVEIFKEVHEKRENSKLLLVGDGDLRFAIEKKCKELGIFEDVIFYGTTDDISKLYNAMDVFVFPSLFEGLGMVMIEAQCNGLRCYLTDSDEVSKESIITNRVETMPLGNANEWAQKILETDFERKDVTEEIINRGYDIETESIKLTEYYLAIG